MEDNNTRVGREKL